MRRSPSGRTACSRSPPGLRWSLSVAAARCDAGRMARIPETGRLAGQTLVDALSAHDETIGADAQEAAAKLALQRLRDIDAVTVSYDEETGRVDVDVSHLVSPAVMALVWLTARLSEATGQTRDEICADLREYFDQA